MLQCQTCLLGTPTGDELGGLDGAQLDDRGRPRGIPADQGLAETSITLGDLLAGLGPELGARKAIGEHGGLGLDGLLETAQPKFSGLDLAISDGATQADTFRPLEGLAQRSRPDLTFVQEGATGVAEPFATDLKRKHRILTGTGRRSRLALRG